MIDVPQSLVFAESEREPGVDYVDSAELETEINNGGRWIEALGNDLSIINTDSSVAIVLSKLDDVASEVMHLKDKLTEYGH